MDVIFDVAIRWLRDWVRSGPAPRRYYVTELRPVEDPHLANILDLCDYVSPLGVALIIGFAVICFVILVLYSARRLVPRLAFSLRTRGGAVTRRVSAAGSGAEPPVRGEVSEGTVEGRLRDLLREGHPVRSLEYLALRAIQSGDPSETPAVPPSGTASHREGSPDPEDSQREERGNRLISLHSAAIQPLLHPSAGGHLRRSLRRRLRTSRRRDLS